jgi:hypothetical protein
MTRAAFFWVNAYRASMALLDEMITQLNMRSATQPEIKRYKALWHEAIAHPGYVLPCPSCYLTRTSGRLNCVNDEGIAVCEECDKRFEAEA